MLYKKPKNLTYTDLCVYVDNHAYKDNITEEERETVYKYIYIIAHMLANKMHLFSDHKYYDDFALWYTAQIFYRLENPKQYEYNEDGTPKMEKIRSVLNYMKSTIAVRKVLFEQQEYSQIITPPETENVSYDYTLSDKINDHLDSLYKAEFDLCLENCCKSIKKFLINRSPYKATSEEFLNLYLSCLLSFLNSVTLYNKDIEKIKNGFAVDNLKLYDEVNKDPVLLYHLPDYYHDIVLIYVREIKHELALELSRMDHNYIGTNSGIYSLMLSEINSKPYEDVS